MPPPAPSQILEQIRLHYVSRLKQAIADHPAEGIMQMVPEAAIRGKNGELLRRGNPPAPVRVDLITLLNGEVRDGLTIDSETMPGFPPFSLQWKHEMPVQISPFPWNACPVRTASRNVNFDKLLEWFELWFDPEETKAPGDDGLLGVVHNLISQPIELDEIRLLIDFGSAPIEAFEDLIDALHSAGAKQLEIGGKA
jgi:hypothetical protein